MKVDISRIHKESKQDGYWEDLVAGTTSQYKEKMIALLLERHFPTRCDRLLDVGCGTCEIILRYRAKLKAECATMMDYDEKIIERMKAANDAPGLEWLVGDVFELKARKDRYGLVFLLDMLHEIYSFYGRKDRDTSSPISHDLGLEHVIRAIENIACAVSDRGGIIITDDVLCEEDVMVRLRMKRQDVIDAVDYFLENYRSRVFDFGRPAPDILEIGSKDLCVMLTQYNKIKKKDWDRWNVERLEVHQYMTLGQYEELFGRLGFETFGITGTPGAAQLEWSEDFELLEGLRSFPDKRITLLAVKK